MAIDATIRDMGNIFGVPFLLIVMVVIIVLVVAGWYLYEVGKERGRKGK